MYLYILISFTLYLFTLIAISYHFYRQKQTVQNFAVGGRSTNYFVTAIATQASDMSGWLILASPAAIYTHGAIEVWTAIGLVVGMFLNWHYIAPQLRIKTEQYNSITLNDLFADYCKDNSGIIRIVSACISLTFFIFYIASGLVGLGRVFEPIFGITYHTGILVGLTATLLYTTMGGFIAVAWSNMFQGLFLLFMIILVPAYTYLHIDPSTATYMWEPFFTPITSWKEYIHAPLLALGWGLGYAGQPHILTYFMGIDDPANIRYAKYVGIIWQITALTAAISIGLVSIPFFMNSTVHPELLFVTLTKTLFHPLLVGFVLCAVLAAILTTMSSHILIAGSTSAMDIYKQCRPTHSDATLVWVSRISSCIISLFALTIAWQDSNAIYNLVSYAWSGLGSAFGPLVIAIIQNRKITKRSAIVGLVLGATVSALWPFLNTFIPALIPGFIINYAIVAFSIF